MTVGELPTSARLRVVAHPLRRGIRELLLVTILACASAPPARMPLSEVGSRLEADLSYLASPALRGRLTGTPGNDSAAVFIARRYFALGLQAPFRKPSCHGDSACARSFLQFFRLPPAVLNRIDVSIDEETQNVAAIVTGTDSALRREYIVVGAHYDHIGESKRYALDPGPVSMHLGADDNASGTVAVLELARRLSMHPTRRPVVFVNFSAEELGLIGSWVFVDDSPIPIKDVITMINLDMVGRLRGNFLILYTSGADDRFHQIVDSVARIPPVLDFRLSWRSAADERGDQFRFVQMHVPVLSPFTDFHVDYHRVSDKVSRINFPGLEKVVDLTERVIRSIADGNTRPGNTPPSR